MVICEKGPYLAVVADQIAYTQSVRDFVRDLMKRFIPGRWASCVIPDGNDRFTERLDAAFLKVDEATATRGDYCNEVVEVLCAELRSVSATLRDTLPVDNVVVSSGMGIVQFEVPQYYKINTDHYPVLAKVDTSDAVATLR